MLVDNRASYRICFLIHSEELQETPLLLLSGFGFHMMDEGLGRSRWECTIDIASISRESCYREAIGIARVLKIEDSSVACSYHGDIIELISKT